MTYSSAERLALSELLAETGPDAPTLCEGWRTRDLVAHLVLREHRPDAAAGVLGGPVARHTAHVQQRYLERYSYDQLIARFRAGPPRVSPLAVGRLEEAANTVEYFVHHEDVRRAAPAWEPRQLDEGLAEILWNRLKGARLFLRKAPVGIELARSDGSGRLSVKKGTPVVTVSGHPAELTLWSMGRAAASRVRLDGPEAAVSQLQAWRR